MIESSSHPNLILHVTGLVLISTTPLIASNSSSSLPFFSQEEPAFSFTTLGTGHPRLISKISKFALLQRILAPSFKEEADPPKS